MFVEGLLGRVAPGRTAPFTVMPIRWELAFGGVSFPLNPLGRGIDPIPDDNGTPIPYLPCIEYPGSRMSETKGPPCPRRPRPHRAELAVAQQAAGHPRPAVGDVPGAAPAQGLRPRLLQRRAGGPAAQEGLLQGQRARRADRAPSREHQRYETALPGKRVRAFALVDNAEKHEKDPNEPEKKFVEVPMNLDTVHLDVQKGEMVLLWRGQAEVTSPQFEEIEACYVTEEDVADCPAMVEEHHAAFVALTTPIPPAAAPAPEVAAPPDAGAKAEEEKLDATINAAMAQITKALKDSKVDPKVVAQVEQTRDPEAIFTLLRGTRGS